MSALNVALPTFAAAYRANAALAVQQLIDVSYLPGSQLQTCGTLLQQANGTDRQMDTVQLHRPSPHTMLAVPIKEI